ncbi:MAG: methyl-accepting chemotaxis protein [Bdellovibrionaceae bacterium]|nr:methyl-accepting chemotaxis protein [Pseudobdellovibrionaceae bacterium]
MKTEAMTVKAQFFLLALIVILVFSGFSFISYLQLSKMQQSMDIVISELGPLIDELYDWNQLNTRAVRSLNLMFTAYGQKDIKTQDSVTMLLNKNVDELKKRLESSRDDKWSSSRLINLSSRWKKFKNNQVEFIGVLEALIRNMSSEAKPQDWDNWYVQLFSTDSVEKRSAWLQEGYDLLSDVRRLAQEQSETSKVHESKASRFQTLSALGLPLFSMFLVFNFYHRIRRVGTQLWQQLLNPLQLSEFKSLRMRQTAQALSQNSTEAAANLEEIVASIEEVESIVQLGAERAREGQGIAKQNQILAEQGVRLMRELNQRMGTLAEQTNRIKSVISLMNDISFQIQLLALNASVEAARAGEQGRGFALVADAVQSLSQKSNLAVKDIEHLIISTVNRVRLGHELTQRLHRTFNELDKNVQRLGILNEKMSDVTQVQSQTLQSMSSSLNVVDQAVQINAGSSEALSGISIKLETQVRDLISAFEHLKVALNLTDLQVSQESKRSNAA